MMLSDCCDAVPYNDIIYEEKGNHSGMCCECKEHCGFSDDGKDKDSYSRFGDDEEDV